MPFGVDDAMMLGWGMNFLNDLARNSTKIYKEATPDWALNAAYNTPANQVARLREAGLNPNLAYGSVTTGNASGPAARQPSTHDTGFEKSMALMSNLMQFAQAIGGEHRANKELELREKDQNLDSAKFFAELAHQQDALELQKKRYEIEDAFRNLELKLRQDEFAHRKGSDASKLAIAEQKLRLAQDRFNWERAYVDGRGYKPGSLYSFADKIVNSVTGENITDVGTDTGNMLTSIFERTAVPVYYGYRAKMFMDKLVQNVSKDLGKKMSKGRYF